MDALNALLIQDSDMDRHFQRLSPHLNVLDTTTPRQISNAVTIHPPVIATIQNWLNHRE